MGPSHPYGMYPQDIGLGRSPTTSTIRPPERSYVGPGGPTHPYGMYAQNTVPEGEVDPVAGAPIVPVGFPGLGQQYTRRLGPDGEDVDDIIGPDGHTEQLPAYTRYPNAEGGQQRFVPGGLPPIMQESSPTLSGHASSPVLTDHGSPGFGANRFSPVIGGHTVLSGHSDPTYTRESINGSLSSDDNGNINLAAAGAAGNGSGSFKEKWIEKSKKPTCCGKLPRWAMFLIVFLSLALAISLAGSLGKWISHKSSYDSGPKPTLLPISATSAAEPYVIPHLTPWPTTADPHRSASTVFATVTATVIDAVSLSSTPTNLPTIPTGSYSVSFGQASRTSNTCLSDPDQQSAAAWDCNTDPLLDIAVFDCSDPDCKQVSLVADTPTIPYRYGAQPPTLSNRVNASLMTDKYDPEKGPAYFFQAEYDKLVVLPFDRLIAPSAKRSLFSRGAGAGAESEIEDLRDQMFERDDPLLQVRSSDCPKPRDKPWFCFWNSTIVEGFLYMQQNTSATSRPSPSYTAAHNGWNNHQARAISTPTTSLRSLPHDVDDYAPLHRRFGQPDHSAVPSSSISGTPPSASPSMKPFFPKAVKIKERRMAGAIVQPYCQLMMMLEGNLVQPALDPAGKLVIVKLGETEPEWRGKGRRRREEGVEKQRRGDKRCACEWSSG